MARLGFATEFSSPDLVTIGSDVIRLDIVDDDGECMYKSDKQMYITFFLVIDIFIGFQLPDTTYPEVEQDHDVTLIKGEGTVTEQELFVVVKLVQTVPPGSGFDVATPSDELGDNDLSFGGDEQSKLVSFPPDVNAISVLLTIFGDELPENTEAAQLTLQAPTDIIGADPPPRFELRPEYPTFFIIIIAADSRKLCIQCVL